MSERPMMHETWSKAGELDERTAHALPNGVPLHNRDLHQEWVAHRHHREQHGWRRIAMAIIYPLPSDAGGARGDRHGSREVEE